VPDAFRSLASIFAAPVTPKPSAAPPPRAEPSPSAVATAASDEHADERIIDLLDGFVAELGRLRARATERLEESAETVLADLAARVLARELCAAPSDIEALIEQAMDEFSDRTRLKVRVSKSDAARLGDRWPLEIDPNLRAGDFTVQIDHGHYDAALATRLETMLALHRVAI
jgi:flagellar biosynthesis/type III secretory pathway protein FliH